MNTRTAKSPPHPARLSFVDVVITILVGVVVAVGLDRPAWTGTMRAPQASSSLTGTLPPPSQAQAQDITEGSDLALAAPAWAQRYPLQVTATEPPALAADPVLRSLQADLSAADAAALAGRVAPGPMAFEVWDLAEREEPLVADQMAATVLLDSLLARVEATPRVRGWFHYDQPASDGSLPARVLGVVTCCWRRPGAAEAAPAGWLVTDSDGRATLRQWVWLGAPGDGATTADLVQAWAASGAWDPEPGSGHSTIDYTQVVDRAEGADLAGHAVPE